MSESIPKLRRPADGKEGKRPFGPFLILAVALLLLIVLYNSDQPTQDVSEDQFWYELYQGHVQDLQIEGPTRLAGTFTGADRGKPVKFRVTVPNTGDLHERVRQLSAKRLEESLGLSAFLRGVEQGELRPERGYALTVYKPVQPEQPSSREREEQRFFVDYSDSEGRHYAEVVGTDNERLNMLALSQTMQGAGAAVEPVALDLVHPLSTEETNSMLMYFLGTLGPILLFGILFWFIFMRQVRGQGQGLLSFGRSRAVLYNKEKKTGVTFEDVAGIDEAKEEVREIIEFLRNPTKFQRLGGRIPRGVLLVGPPGTGKTLLAKAIAGEAGVPFLSISGSDFVEMFVGVGASRVRDLFKQAKDSAPCIVFLDEIDAVGRKRGTGMGGGHDEREQTLNAILVEMDGFGTDEGIIVCAATNRPDVLDPALLRPGRFDRQVVIDLPDIRGREKILQVHSRKVKLGTQVDLGAVARGTPGFSGAELAALVNEAAIGAVMNDRDTVTQPDLEEARDKVLYGRQKRSRVMDPEDRKVSAFHEAGHAVVNALLPDTEPLHKVTIIPRGMMGGATMFLPERDRPIPSRKRALASLTVSFGGRVAEELFCGDITAGAASDIRQATHTARLMVTEWGMSERLGPVNYADRTGSDFLGTEIAVGRDHSEATVREIDEEVQRLLLEARERAKDLLSKNPQAVERVAQALLHFETLQGEEVHRLIEGCSLEELRKEAAAPSQTAADPAKAVTDGARPAPRSGKLPYPGTEGLSPA